MATPKTQTPTQSQKASDDERRDALIAKWLRSYVELFPMYGQTVSPEKLELWCELLSDLSPSSLDEAFRRAAETCKDFPSVADVREAVAALRDARRALPERKGKAHDDCALCDGTGWEPVCGGVARCRCTQGLAFPRAPERKQLPPAEFRELMAVAKGRAM